jgi:hypothetical protein
MLNLLLCQISPNSPGHPRQHWVVSLVLETAIDAADFD